VRKALQRALTCLAKAPGVPPEALGLASCLLHVSDTPSFFYADIGRIAEAVKPRFIVHTGDLADEIKLRSPSPDRKLYASRVQALLKVLQETSAERIFLVMGNHDDFSVVLTLSAPLEGRFLVYEHCARLELEGVRIAAAHRPEDLWKCVAEDRADFGLYGHDTSVLPPDADGRQDLNGNVKIRVLDLFRSAVHSFDYPRAVHDARQRKRKTGL
jgi:predicted phosphodiesterase